MARQTGTQTTRARELRRAMTDAEKALWRWLRDSEGMGTRFRRQRPIGHYVVDFVSLDARLVVELDGGHHDDPDVRAYDEDRTQFLEDRGFRVVRFQNDVVLRDPREVAEAIAGLAKEAPLPQAWERDG